MAKRSLPMFMFPGALCCFLLLFVTACTSLPVGAGDTNTPTPGTTGTPTSTATQTPQQTVPMPQTNTSCPTTNTARAAMIRPLALGSHQNLVYIYNDVPQNTSIAYGILRRYDTTTGQKTDIVTSGIEILQAQVSGDGQWVLFLSRPDPRGGLGNLLQLQLVRMDGQGLQTLMCLPYTDNGLRPPATPIISVQWSIDEKSILISYNGLNQQTQQAISSIDVLNVSTGALKPAFLDPADSQYLYTAVTLLNNTQAYVIKRSISSTTLPATLFLMNIATATVANPGLQNVLNLPPAIFTMDSSYGGTQLFISACVPPSAQTITVQPATGGTSHDIYHDTNSCVLTLRAVAGNTLLLVVQASGGTSYQVWTMHPDGSGKHVLNTLSVNSLYELNENSQLPWSNVSRDGTTYALQQGATVTDQGVTVKGGQSVILIGSLNGGNPTVIASTAGSLSTTSLAGWTTM
jgi:hypothetical protein